MGTTLVLNTDRKVRPRSPKSRKRPWALSAEDSQIRLDPSHHITSQLETQHFGDVKFVWAQTKGKSEGNLFTKS